MCDYCSIETVIDPAATPIAASVRLLIDESSQIGAARRSAAAIGHAEGLDADALGRLAIVLTEAATNIVRHAGRGIVLRALMYGDRSAIEILALDKGPGIANVARAMGDGFSTAGTAGQGLGGMRRLADVFDIYSQRGTGTAIVARVADGPRDDRRPRAASHDDRSGVVCVPVDGETECGDAWRIVLAPKRVSILLVDGLGHGQGAAEAAAIATSAFTGLASGPPTTALVRLDTAMRGTRGAALSVAVIDEADRRTRFSGVGNVDGRVLSGVRTEHLVPQSGIVGHTMPTPRCTTGSWPRRARLVMHSDGISAKWQLNAYPGLISAHPALIAGVIYRDFRRDRDDATVLVFSDGVVDE